MARHLAASPGSPRLDDAHYPPAPPGALNREPKARTQAEAEFLAIGIGRRPVAGRGRRGRTARVRAKMAQAVQLAALHGPEAVDRALGQAAAAGRFADGDLASILAHQASAAPGEPSRAGEDPHPRPGHRRLGAPATAGRRQAGDRGEAATGTPSSSAPGTRRFIRRRSWPPLDIFGQAEAAGGPGYRALRAAALDAPGGGRPLAGVHYDVCLAVGHIDFPDARQEDVR